MARTGRGWDAKPPAPKRRPANTDPGDSTGAGPRAAHGDFGPGPAGLAHGDSDGPRPSGADEAAAAIGGASARREPGPGDPRPPGSARGAGPNRPGNIGGSDDQPGGSGDKPRLGHGRSLPWSNRDIYDTPDTPAYPSADDGAPPARRGRSLPWSNRDTGDGFEGGGAAAASPRDELRGGGVSEGSARRGRGRPRRGSEGDSAGEAATHRGRAEDHRHPEEIAREICLRQLAVRPRTRAELETVLKKKGVAEEVARAVLDRYSEVGMIDDAAFAQAWVTSRHHSKGLATRALAQELRRKGVDQEVAADALSELDSDTEAQTALDLALRKLRTTRGEPEQVFRRLLAMLARKGYPGGVAVRAVKEALATRDAELADLIDPDAYEE